MPIDPSIILGVRPVQIPQQDPLEQFSKGIALKGLLGKQDLQDLQTEQARLGVADDTATRTAYQQAGGDNTRLRQLLQAGGQYKGVQALDKFELDKREKQSIIDKNDAAAAKNKWDVAIGQVQHGSAIMSTATDQASYDAARRQIAMTIDPKLAEQMPPVYDPAFVKSKIDAGMTVVQKLTAQREQAAQDENKRHHGVTEKIEGVKADPFGILGINKNPAPAAQAGVGLSGDDYLKTLAPGIASQVKALAEGKLQMSPRTLQSPQGAALLQMAMQYEPGTDQTVYASRAATAKDAATGKLATSNNALNTVTGHMAGLADAADKLDNTRFPWVNSVKNAVLNASGDPRVKEFNLNMQGVANELERAYRGAGGTEADIKLWRESLSSASSPEQFKGVMAKGAEMLQSKLEANQAQYEQGMRGRPGDYRSITPKTEKALARLRGAFNADKGEPAAKGKTGVLTPNPDGSFNYDF